MAISSTTDWSKIRYIMFVLFFISALLASTVATGLTTSGKQKRQLFREHLLPQHGGKIPDGAFDPSRISLNKLSQNGIFSPDGYHIAQRHPDRHHNPKQYLPNTLKVHQYPENRFVAPHGQHHDLQTIDTTYLIREPVQYPLFPPLKYYPSLPFYPQYSLKLLRHFKYDKVNDHHDGSWNEIELPAKHQTYEGYAVAPKLRQHEKEQQQDFSKIPGIPGKDYPLFHSVPPTSFSCKHVPAHPGIYANVETGCQAYHVCHDGREGEQGASFLCTNGTIFNQAEFACDWWYNVNCHEAPNLYRLNLDPTKNPYVPKPKPEEELHFVPVQKY
ncbi:uncharacterized protein LOC123006360 [Tribolium madens]|uniref:uncharacterized protein LOC123006360 n=1 Tax=Tribolium madens TaxID=41895 RepID=UPI001CF75264|nr:uncharacterized protein LOC123006360 [Tribolium madens]